MLLGHARKALVIAMLALPALPLAARSQPARPLVLVVHGRGLLGHDSAEVRRDAWHTLDTGLRAAGADFSLGEGDVRLVWYADILDSRAAGPAITACPVAQLGDSLHQRESIPSIVSLVAMIAGPLFDVASGDAKGQDAADLRSLAGDLRFLADLDTRCAAERRVDDALREAHRSGRPVILVSHSLGSLFTWSALSHAEAVKDTSLGGIEEWITLGSPLGSAEIRGLVLGDDRSSLAQPQAVHTWTNVLGRDDPFAIRVSEAAGSAVSDVQTDVAHDSPHDLLSYLDDQAVARSIVHAWHAAGRSH